MEEKKTAVPQVTQQTCSHERRPLVPNSCIGEYRIVRAISQNGEGITYLAQDSIIGDTVQVQEFFPAHMARRGQDGNTLEPLAGCATNFKYFRASFMDLYQTLQAEKDNACLIPMIQILEQNATVYVVSEYREMGTLEEYLQMQGGKESWCKAKHYLLPVYNALSSLHKKGITHQGLSPQNILLDEEGTPFLRGFCLSEIRTAQGDLESELFAGYSAPEQYQEDAWQGVWTDIYSMAAVTYRVLTGEVPPEAPERKKKDTLRFAAQLDQNIPDTISEALDVAMQLDTSKRYDSIDTLMRKLLEMPSSNTAIFSMEDETERTAVFPAQGEFIKEKTEPQEDERTSRAKTGSVYIVVTMMATLLVLVLGAPQLYRLFIGGWTSSLGETSDVLGNQTGQPIELQPVTTEEEPHKVENFVGRKATDVTSNARYQQWYYFETVEKYSDDFSEGMIVDQSISSGTEIKKKTTVTLYVSKGSETQELPNLSGQTMENAIATLEGMGKRWKVVEGDNSTVEPGEVFRTEPPAGTELNKNSSDLILLYVAKDNGSQQSEDDEQQDTQTDDTQSDTSQKKYLRKESS